MEYICRLPLLGALELLDIIAARNSQPDLEMATDEWLEDIANKVNQEG